MFGALSDRFEDVFANLRGKKRLSPADIDSAARDIRVALLEADVALPVVRAFIAAVKDRAAGEGVHRALDPAQQVVKIVNEELIAILGGDTPELRFADTGPTVILLTGQQGAGKTTLAGKLAAHLARQGRRPLLVAADLHRPNAVTQLEVMAARAGVPVYAPQPGNGIGDPVTVAADGVRAATGQGCDVVIVDTAGRLGNDTRLMAEAAAIRAAVNPTEVLFVIDAMSGHDAVTTATAFADSVGFTGIVLTKLDGDARGGAALSVRHVTGQPVKFASTGEQLTDFDVFHPDRMASRILGMGDLLTLIEKAEDSYDEKHADDLAAKLTGRAEFTLEDFLAQLLTIKKMGPLTGVLALLPGAGQVKDALNQIEDRDLDRAAAIIRSMTAAERRDPRLLDAGRRRRVAAGAGVTPEDVDALVDRFDGARAMMTELAAGFGITGGRVKSRSSKKGKHRKGKRR